MQTSNERHNKPLVELVTEHYNDCKKRISKYMLYCHQQQNVFNSKPILTNPFFINFIITLQAITSNNSFHALVGSVILFSK